MRKAIKPLLSQGAGAVLSEDKPCESLRGLCGPGQSWELPWRRGLLENP